MSQTIERLKTLTVSDVMSKKVVWVSTRQRMADVATILLKHEISSAPVEDETGSVVGIISATDFLRRDSNHDDEQAPNRPRPAWTPDDVVSTFMTTAVQTVDANTSLLHAARVMCALHVHRLPVVSHDGKPVGVISTMDIVAAIVNIVAEQEA